MSPAILQTTPSTVDYLGLKQAYAIVSSLSFEASVPIALHLDHCESFEGVMQAIKAGYSSVMIDAVKNLCIQKIGVCGSANRALPFNQHMRA